MTIQRVYKTIVAVGLAVVLARLAQIVRDLAIAKYFGISQEADAFFLAVLIPMHVINVVAGSIGVAIVPQLIKAEEETGGSGGQKLVQNTLTITLIGLVVCSILTAVLFPLVAPLLAAHSDRPSSHLSTNLLLAMLPMLVMSGISTVWSAILTAKEKFALPSLVPVITPMVVLLFLPLWPEGSRVYALAVGTSVGALLEFSIIGFALKRRGYSLWPRWHGWDPATHELWGLLGPLAGGAAVLTLVSLLPQFLATGLGPGAVSILSYSTKATTVAASIAAVAIATVTQTYFSRLIAVRDWSTLRSSLNRVTLLGFGVLSVLTVFVVLASVPITRLMFQRGAFTETDTALVAPVQALYALQIPWAALSVALYRLMAAVGARRFLWLVPVGGVLVLAILAPILSSFMGVRGLALVVSIFHIVSTFAYWYLLSQVLIPRELRNEMQMLAVQPEGAR